MENSYELGNLNTAIHLSNWKYIIVYTLHRFLLFEIMKWHKHKSMYSLIYTIADKDITLDMKNS